MVDTAVFWNCSVSIAAFVAFCGNGGGINGTDGIVDGVAGVLLAYVTV